MIQFFPSLLNQPKINLTENLVAYWSFDGNGIDSVSSISPIEEVSVVYNAVGILGNATEGFNSRIRYADSDIYTFSDGVNDLPFSISCWVYFTSISGRTGNWIIAKTPVGISDQGEFEFYFNIPTQRFQFQKYSDNTTGRFRRVESFANLVQINTWNHVVVTSVGDDSSGMNIYINGVNQSDLRTNSTNYTTISNTTAPITMRNAGSFPQNASRLDGRLDEVGIWKNRELTIDEILFLYNNGNGRTYIDL